ncbi:amidohydrolase [Sunxiuqinia sp. A32]|uniref:amidohydrolase n=1 Tax=Sunxiuqinia sp. A32 TaxID=3461496 RepID=UPI00404661CB
MTINDTLNIALIQTDLFWEEPKKNRLHFESLFGSLEANVDLVVLPEMFATGFSMQVQQFAEGMQGETISWMKQQASARNITLAGSLMIKENENFYNRFVFIGADDKIDSYDKRHLFAMGQENLHFTAGNKRKVFEISGFRILPQVCYDLRFPVFSRNQNDYDLLINCANWPAPRQTVWNILLKARAIENQAFVAGVNRVGVDNNGIRYSGGSQIVDAKGSEMASSGNNEEIVIAKLNKASLMKFRRNFPVLKDSDDFIISD